MKRIFAITLGFCCASSAIAEPQPRWELGVAVGAINLPDYRGSDERQAFVVPWPYIIYRSERLNVDREGLRGRLYRSSEGQAQIVLSIGASPPVDSEENFARRGMSPLDPTLELGPSFEWRLRRDSDTQLWLNFPLRAVVATDLTHAEFAGWLFAPHVEWKRVSRNGRDTFTVSAGPLFADNRYHDYYYTVAPAFALLDRPVYDARAGYSGARLAASATRRAGPWWLGVYGRYENLSGARFSDSPLVKRDSAWIVGAGVAYVFAVSSSVVSDAP